MQFYTSLLSFHTLAQFKLLAVCFGKYLGSHSTGFVSRNPARKIDSCKQTFSLSFLLSF
jgi:hypothetical protein